MSPCEDCVPCEADHCDAAAYCLADPVGSTRPCNHERVLCEAHNLELCIDCRLEAERDMFRAGEYDPRSDPFYNHLAKPAPRTQPTRYGGIPIPDEENPA